MKKYFTKAEDDFLRDHITECLTLYDLTDLFNAEFPNHQITCCNLQKRLKRLGLKKGTHNIRKERVKHINEVGTIIANKNGKKARIKTENGYVSAHDYFRNKICGDKAKDHMLVNLNGDKTDFSEDNIEIVTKSIYASLCWRGWFFKDRELTKTAILTARLLEFFPDLRHNENQYYKLKR